MESETITSGEVAPVAAPRRRNANGEEGEQSCSREEELSTPWENFMKIHTQAYASTKEGQIFDEEGFKDKAFNSYQKSLELIDKAIQISYGGGFSTEELNKVSFCSSSYIIIMLPSISMYVFLHIKVYLYIYL